MFKSFNFNMSASAFSFILDWYHYNMNSMLVGIFFLVGYLVYRLFIEKRFFKVNGEMYVILELICVIIPSMMATVLVYYSLYILYTFSIVDIWVFLNLKVIGSQWYWSYELANMMKECTLLNMEELSIHQLYRNFNTTPSLILPWKTNIRSCMTSTDVIHSWSLPSMGVKMDCNPGLLTTFAFQPTLIGSFFGGCAEICGVGHSMMPIYVEIVTPNIFNVNLIFIECVRL